MAKAKSTYEEDYGEYVPGEDDIAVTYKSTDAAEEAILRSSGRVKSRPTPAFTIQSF